MSTTRVFASLLAGLWVCLPVARAAEPLWTWTPASSNGATAHEVGHALVLRGAADGCAGWVSPFLARGQADAVELEWEWRATQPLCLLVQVESGHDGRKLGQFYNHQTVRDWSRGRMIVDLPTDARTFRVFIGTWRTGGQAEVRAVGLHPLKRVFGATGDDLPQYLHRKSRFGQRFRAAAEGLDRVALPVTRQHVQADGDARLICRLAKPGSEEVLAQASIPALALPTLVSREAVFDVDADRLEPGETYELSFRATAGERYYGYVLQAGLDSDPDGRMVDPRGKGGEYDLAVRGYARLRPGGPWPQSVPPPADPPPAPGPAVRAPVGRPGRRFSELPEEAKRRVESVLARPSRPDPFYATPSYSYAGMTAEDMLDLGIGQMLYLLYWDHWETAPDEWSGAYIDNRLADMGHRAAAGIRLAVRLGDGHPGARLWTTRRGKPYLGRNAKAYPGDQDTDERYFAYLRRLVSKLKGRVGSYTVGDELDSQFGCDSHTPRRLREYYDFFVRAARVIHSVDPAAEVVMFPPAWGYERALADLAMMCQWGYREAGSGIALNVAFGRLRRPERLHTFVTGVRSLSPQFKLYSNGVGYCMDRFPEREQAVRVFHTMFKLWDAGWSQAPYYLLGSHRHLWSSGLVSRGADGQLVRRAAWAAFQTCAQVFYDRAACKRPGFGIEVQPAGDGLGVPGRKYMVNGPASDAALFSYVRGRELLLVLMQYAFDSDTTTRVNVRVRSGHFRHPVRVPMLSPRGRRDVAYELLPDGSVRLQGLMVTAEPTIVRMVAEP